MTLRGEAALLTTELVVVLACAIAPLPVPAQLPLLVMAMISLGLRGQTWAERVRFGRDPLVVGAATGVAALVLALAITPWIERGAGSLVQWSSVAAVRGKPEMFLVFALITTVMGLAAEMVLRGWVLERVRTLGPGRTGPIAGIAIAAVVEAVFTSEPGAPAFGSFLVGVALGTMYLAAGRNLVVPVAARVCFEVGALVVQATRLVG